MPANLTPQYLSAELRFKQAASVPEKIVALEEMMALIPKHKGTEKMQAALKQKMAKLLEEKDRKFGVSKASAMYTVQREGAGQAVLIGAANAGKSSLLARLTHATPEIADYPFTTHLPQPGMMPFEDIQIQLVDLPPIALEVYKPWVGGIIRQADLVLLTVDLGSDDVLDQVDEVLKILEGGKIYLVSEKQAPEAAAAGAAHCRTLLLANKFDSEGAQDSLSMISEMVGTRFPILPVSAVSGHGLAELPAKVFAALEVIRIYTKLPGKKLDTSTAPFVLKRGSTVLDATRAVHRDLVHTLRFAKVWSYPGSRGSVRFDGQMVERTHVLEDRDVLELHK